MLWIGSEKYHINSWIKPVDLNKSEWPAKKFDTLTCGKEMCISSGRDWKQNVKHCCHKTANYKNVLPKLGEGWRSIDKSAIWFQISTKYSKKVTKCWPILFVTNLLQNPVLPDLHFAKEVCRLKNIGEAQTTNRLQNNVSIFLRPLSRPGPCSFIGFRTVLTFDKWSAVYEILN